MKLVLLFLSLSALLFAKEPLSRFDRFVCDDGLKLLKKTYILSYAEGDTYSEALDELNRVHKILASEVEDEKNYFFNEFKLAIIFDHLEEKYLVIDSICFSKNIFNSDSTVNSLLMKNRYGLETQVIKVHTNRWDGQKGFRGDYLELIFESERYSFSNLN
ncbi:MAG: hypothetical protein CME64_11570 [Halobacteriovoraceae bacterium]|nr:hypothetical protein [Halobacteriovoraceae bacterium]|tara:strand:+ start:64939 stop:65418 length:480 start_codon:yes stop_codon:yes gene_type:complete